MNSFGQDPLGEKKYLTPFSPETVQTIMKNARGPIGSHRGISLSLYKEESSNPVSVKTLEEFLAPFDEIWNHIHTPNPILKIDSKSLLKDIISAQEQKQYQ